MACAGETGNGAAPDSEDDDSAHHALSCGVCRPRIDC